MSRFSARRPSFLTPTTAKVEHHVSGVIDRRAAQAREAASLLEHLPESGCAFHALMTGRYDLMDVIAALAAREPIFSLRIATLSYNARNLTALLALIDGGRAASVSLLCSAFFRDHNKELWAESVPAFRERGMRIAAARSHAKVVCLDVGGRGKLIMEGSANLRTNSNVEQLTIISDPDLHDWHYAWIGELLDRHEPENEAADGEG